MKQDNKHKEHMSWEEFDELQKGSKISWSKSKDAIWDAMEEKLENEGKSNPVVRTLPILKYAAAAAVILLISVTALMRYYSETFETAAGEHLAVNLPDGSTVELNAESSLKYYPLWWVVERKMVMNGEAFFEVEKGNKFVVKSANGKTKVLGTSFNIYSREEDYRVNCVTGKVQVTASKNKVILLPNDEAVLNKSGSITIKHGVKEEATISWMDGKFFFTSVPLQMAIDEIERQYGVKVWNEASKKLNYTGNFSRDLSVEETLDYVCKSLGVKYVKKQEGEYRIIQNE